MNYRTATLDDTQAISNLLTKLFAYNASQQPDNYIAATEDGSYPSTVINSDTGDFIIAEADNLIVGLVHVEEVTTPPYPSIKPRKYAAIVDFFVNEQQRKKNIGHMLLEKVKEWAQVRQLEYVELMVLEDNHIGRNFYEREEFITTSRTLRLCL